MDDNLLLDFIDVWNEKNPTERLSPHVTSMIGMYLNMAYGMGYDSAINELKRNVKHLAISKGTIMKNQLFDIMKIYNK